MVVAIGQILRGPNGCRIHSEVYVQDGSRHAVLFVNLKHLAAAVASLHGGDAGISVVEYQELRSILGFEIPVVLMREPGIRVAGVDLEIAVLAESPEDLPVAVAAVIRDLDEPILVARGVQDVAIRGLLKGVSVSPIVSRRC